MKPLRLSLSGAGFLGAWHLGVSDALLRAGVLENGSLQVAGASAGAIVGAVIVAGVPLQQARLALSALAMEARSQPFGIVTPGYSLVDGVLKHLDEHLPLDAHQRASGRLHVALTSLRLGEVGALYHKCSFGSRDELIHAVTSSSDIPGLTGCLTRATTPCLAATAMETLPAPANVWQALTRRLDVDGGLWDLFPDPWHGTGDVAFVSPFAGVGFAISPSPSKAADAGDHRQVLRQGICPCRRLSRPLGGLASSATDADAQVEVQARSLAGALTGEPCALPPCAVAAVGRNARRLRGRGIRALRRVDAGRGHPWTGRWRSRIQGSIETVP